MADVKSLVVVNDVKTVKFWQAVGAEFIGTMVLMFVQAILPLGLGVDSQEGNVVRIGIGVGFVVVTLASSLGHISGGHFNPAVTISMLFACNISFLKGAMYVIAQCIGAITGAAIAYGVTPLESVGALSATTVNPSLSPWQGLVVEAMLGFILLQTIHGSTDERFGNGAIAPIAIGFAVALDILSAALYTGASINPARSFGPAVILGGQYWEHHWVYWFGPTSGGIIATLIYRYMLTFNRSDSVDITSNQNGNLEMKASDNDAFQS